MKSPPVIIIGAPRSGTNMLRDVLTSMEGLGTWPCDEINYIWRHGNVTHETDELSPQMATDPVKRYIDRQFESLQTRYALQTVVEKTCANSLRVPFVDAVMPEARYLFIHRDGLDAVGSALQRWKARLDFGYLLAKARYVPISDLPYYGFRYLGNRVFRLLSREKRLAFWGPSFSGLKEALDQYSLEEVCALQWQRCVNLSESAFANMPADKVVRVGYESFVANPETELQRILAELDLSYDEAAVRAATAAVSDRSVGKGRDALDTKKRRQIEKLVGPTLARYGYL